MVDYKLFRYAGPPRTGSTWVLKAAHQCGLGEGFKSTVHLPHTSGKGSSLRVVTVRHPCDWLASYYTNIYPGSTGIESIDALKAATEVTQNFDEFILLYLKWCRQHGVGFVGKIFDSYHGDSCLRTEDLPWSFIELVESCGVPRKLTARCLALDPQNISVKALPVWNPSLRRQVMEVEEEMIERYEY